MRTSNRLLKYGLQLCFYLYIYIIDIIIYRTLSFLTLSIIFIIFFIKLYTPFIPKYLIFDFFDTTLTTRLIKKSKYSVI
jgi:hypothetical protein